ncbi:caprin homolog [Condylostylus longicornis]|uniref:caprin homolog n=1 Tax=Condylostylus longicornis TaxID=2530218 RepID=UPI00244E048A|nr:caprin homolog [Condylostylus longicornis]
MPEKISNLTQSIENNNALRQALVVIEHKIRNLEKRKTKLESYRTIQSSGKELSSDQKAAVAKYDEVAQSLEFARDLSKQMLQIAIASEKEEKKRVRKEAILRAQAETAKIREVLTIQNILVAFSDENIRNDFLNGVNGAVKLEQSDLNVMEKFCLDIQIKRQESPSDQPFLVSAQKAAEHFSLTIDGRPKQYGDTTYENVKGIFQKIQDSGYLDRAGNDEVIFEEEETSEEQVEENTTNENEQNDPESITERIPDVESTQKVDPTPPCTSALEEPVPVKTPISQIIPVQIDQQPNNMPKFTSEAPSAAAVPAPAFPPAPQTPVSQVVAPGGLPTQLQQPQIALQQIQRQQGPHQIPLQHPPQAVQQIPAPTAPAQIQGVPAPGHFPPTTVRAVEQAYFKQHQYIQQMRPLAEVIGGGNFFFLQDSELDSPDMIGLPAPPHGFPAGQSQHPQQQPQNQQQTLTENQQANVVNLPAASPTQTQPLPGLSAIQQQQNGITQVSNVQQNSQQQQTQQQQSQTQPQQTQQQPQINKQSVNSVPAPQANISGQPVPNNLSEQPTTAIPTQTFTNQSFPPIVPPPQVQSIFPAASNSHSSPGIHQQTPVVNINPNVNNEKSQQPSAVVPNTPLQQIQTNQSQAPQITQVFNQNHSTMPSITPHQLIAHHQQQQQQQQQQTLSAQSQQSVAGTTSNLTLAEQQVAALATLQQQHHNPHPQLQQSTTNQNNLSGLPTGFVNAKFPSNIVSASQAVSAQQQQQQPSQIPPHHSLNNQNNNINSGATGTLSQQSSQDKYDQAVRILEHKTQKMEIKERTNQVQVKDIIATASVNDWETDATKLQMQQQTSQQVHKPPSHYSTSHNTSHFHAAQHHNTNNNTNNSANDRGGSNINDSNQWSNDMHTNSQHSGQNSSNNATSGLNNKNNDWVSTFDSQESNHWNSSEASTNYRGRQSFNRNDRTNGGGPGNSSIRNDRNDNSRSGNTGGYRGRSSYSTSQNSNGNSSGPGGGNGGGIAGGNRNSVYFRNNDNYYQNGNNNGYNGGNKDNGGNRYGGGGNNAGESYRGRPTAGGGNAGGGPRSGGNGPPPRQQRGSLGSAGGGSGGMGPRGQAGGPRTSAGAYSSRPPRQQDVNVVN